MHLACKDHSKRVVVVTQATDPKPHVLHRADGVRCDTAVVKIGDQTFLPHQVLRGFPRSNHIASKNYELPATSVNPEEEWEVNPNLITALQGPPLTPEESLLTEIFQTPTAP